MAFVFQAAPKSIDVQLEAFKAEQPKNTFTYSVHRGTGNGTLVVFSGMGMECNAGLISKSSLPKMKDYANVYASINKANYGTLIVLAPGATWRRVDTKTLTGLLNSIPGEKMSIGHSQAYIPMRSLLQSGAPNWASHTLADSSIYDRNFYKLLENIKSQIFIFDATGTTYLSESAKQNIRVHHGAVVQLKGTNHQKAFGYALEHANGQMFAYSRKAESEELSKKEKATLR